MKGFLGSFLMLLTAAMATACLPTTASVPENIAPATAVTPALKRAPKQESPDPEPTLPRVPTSDEPYPAYPLPAATGTPLPYPYPLEGIETTPVMSEFDIFAATRAAELGVPELDAEQTFEVMQLLQGTAQAAQWRDLDEELPYLSLAWDPIVELQPGESHDFSVGLRTSIFYDFPLLDIQTSWSLSPTVGAAIDPQTGFFTVDEETAPGTVYTVTADVENGRAVPTIEVYVYTPRAYPLIGFWHEEKQFTCTGDEIIVEENAIGELRFLADGTFDVAWFPFESYRDYRGTYRYDKASGELMMTIEDGAYIPADFDGSGFAALDTAERLVLKDMWLGSPQYGKSSTNCGHVFFRYET